MYNLVTKTSNVHFNYNLPLEITLTCVPGAIMAVCMNQGKPRQTRISNTFDPTAFEMAISP